MQEEFLVICPYCGEQVDLYLEEDIEGSLVQDCEVCCNPWQIHVWSADDRRRHADISRADGSE